MLCRGDLNDHKQRLQEAEVKNEEGNHILTEKNAQIVQLQQEKGDLVAFQQDMLKVGSERQKAMQSLSAFQAAFSAAQVCLAAVDHTLVASCVQLTWCNW